ncbi:hypothetical protein ACLBWZ_16085 [Brucellaceae bacterium C25G]
MRVEAGWKSLLRCTDDWLGSLKPDVWDEALKNENHTFFMLRERVSSDDLKLMPENIREPMINHALALALGLVPSAGSCDFIFGTLSKNIQRGAGKDFLERLEGKNVTIEGFTNLWLSYQSLLSSINFDILPDVSLRKLLIPAVQTELAKTIDFFRLNHKKLRRAILSADDDVRGEMLDYIASRYPDGDRGLNAVVSFLDISKEINLLKEKKLDKADDIETTVK